MSTEPIQFPLTSTAECLKTQTGDDPAVPVTGPAPIVECSKCKRPTELTPNTKEEHAICPLCFANALNARGTAVEGDPEKPVRMTWHERITPEEVERLGPNLPVVLHDVMMVAAEGVPEQMAANAAGLAAMFVQAKKHGLLVMVVVQPAIAAATPPSVDVQKREALEAVAKLKRPAKRRRK